jgi:hypothetical protein
VTISDRIRRWYIRSGKSPKRLDDGRWRWILPDPPTAEGKHDLPKPVFDRLAGGDDRLPWIYPDASSAVAAACDAAVDAIAAGEWEPSPGA